MKFIDKKIEEYCTKHSNQESKILNEIYQYTFNNEKIPQMISGSIVSNFIQLILKSINAKKILEIGTFTGYSAINMAMDNPNCEIHTCEIAKDHAKTAKKFIKTASLENNIFVHCGAAIDTIEGFKVNSFDFAFIDADKINYLEYYKRVVMLVKKSGVIILDNMLWSGEVINPKDANSKILNKTAQYIQKDSRVFNTLLPIRDGLMVCYKK
ncbi:MAG: methyltransferase [Candidatus Marinimicrobia bacterium]|nr:methyltransferase [Candidatus Neomarinimicrobiota bacterium]|tara:strand:+ start:31541 stop:32173 length:633 start_codon:yes stop_codon:yes gene_type:complete